MTQNNQTLLDEKKTPEGYQKTEVGIIPDDWEVIPLGGLSTISRLAGAEYTSMWVEDDKGEIIALRGFNIGKNTINLRDIVRISSKLSKKLIRSKLCKYDVVYPCVGTIGNAAVIYENDTYHIQQNIARITPKRDLLNSEYLASYLISDLASKEVSRFNATSSQPNVLVSSLRQYRVPCPSSLEEQEKIAQVLSDTDALISELEKLIEKKQAIKTATMQQLLTGKTRLPEFALHKDGTPKAYKDSELGKIPEDWEVKKLSEITTYINDGTHHTPNYVNNGIPFYSVENVSSNDFENVKYITNEEHQRLLKRCRPEKGDILLTRIGTLAKTRLIDWDIDASIYVSLALIKLQKHMLSSFVYAFTKTNIFMKEVEKRSLINATPQKINMDEIKNVPILIPRDVKEQIELANIYLSLEAELNKLTKQLFKVEQIKIGMMQELLTGKTRLV